MSLTDIRSTIISLIFPLFFIGAAQLFLLLTALRLLVTLDLRTLFSLSKLQEAAFSRFWIVYGPMTAAVDDGYVKPIMARASGRVLDIGPGTGLGLRFFDRTKATKIYGIEPNAGMHGKLKEEIKKNGLEGVYEIVGCGVEDAAALAAKDIHPGSIDTIVTVKVLCSIPHPEHVLPQLYQCLAPGGQWLVYEHIANRDHILVRVYQSLLQLVWPHVLAGCNLTRHTDEMLLAAGVWSNVDLGPLPGVGSWKAIPFVQGRLVKVGKNDKVQGGDIAMPEVHSKGIIHWYRNQDMGLLVLAYMSVSYVFWGLLEGLK